MKLLKLALVLILFGACAGQNPPENPSANQTRAAPSVPDPMPPASDPSPSPNVFRDLIPIQPELATSLALERADWYLDSVAYHIWVNAFHDSDGSGVGDLKGITQKLDYLANLGIDLIWLSPFFESSSEAINLHMYDTINHYNVDPRFGNNQDVEELLREAHRRGMKVIFDYVPNHVSNKHPWFVQSANNQNGYRDWFVWRTRAGSQRGPWGQSVWHRHSSGFYYGVFWSGMPDINWRHQPAKDTMTNVAIHWLNKGFDGMRVDAIKYLYEDVRSLEGGYADQPETLAFFEALRNQILEQYSQKKDASGKAYHKMMVAENWTGDYRSLLSYLMVDNKPAFHLSFDFPLAYYLDNLNKTGILEHGKWVSALKPPLSLATFLSNHDNVTIRPSSKHQGNLLRAVIAIQLFWPGVPFIYYGNEIGMPDASRFAGQPHADRRHRQPFDWTLAETQLNNPNSLLNFHKQAIRVRRSRPSLRRGNLDMIESPNKSLVFIRQFNNERTLVVLNLQDAEIPDFSIELPMASSQTPRLLWSSGSPTLRLQNNKLVGPLGAAFVGVWDLP